MQVIYLGHLEELIGTNLLEPFYNSIYVHRYVMLLWNFTYMLGI